MSANIATVPLHKCLICERPVELIPGTDDCWRHTDGARTHHIVSPAVIHPLWKGREMKPGYAICKNCEYPIRPAPDGRGKHVWVHIEALPRCHDPLPMRQAELEKLVGARSDRSINFCYRFSAEAAAGLFIDEPKPPKPDHRSVQAEDERTGIRLLLDQLDQNGDRSAVPIEFPTPHGHELWNFFVENHGLHLLDSELNDICLAVEKHLGRPAQPTPWYKSRWYWITTIGYALLVKFAPQIKHLLLG